MEVKPEKTASLVMRSRAKRSLRVLPYLVFHATIEKKLIVTSILFGYRKKILMIFV